MTAVATPEWAAAGACERLAAVARGWLGTPFRHRAAVRGVGVDCVMLVGEIFRAAGVVTEYAFPAYSLDYSQHQEPSLLRGFLDAHPMFCLLPDDAEPRVGDVVCFKIGKTEHHAGVMVNEVEFVHAVRVAGVVYGRLDDSTFAKGKRWTCTYRPLKEPRIL